MLKDKKVILASASPRRAELFKLLGINAKIIPADVAEPLTDELPPIQAIHHASNKASLISEKYGASNLVVAADTVVAIDKHILGKPDSVAQACQYLKLLSGRKHSVFTGLCLMLEGKTLSSYEHTFVQFAALSETEIEAYIATQEPMDKAGAYGIQGYGAQFIVSVQGCYFNVMGLPIRLFYNTLQALLGIQNSTEQESFQPLSVESFQPLSVESFQPLSVESFQPLSVESFQPLSVESFQPLSVESFQPYPGSNMSPIFKAERTTHDTQSTQQSPFIVHSAVKTEPYLSQNKAESTPNFQSSPQLPTLPKDTL